MEQNSKNNFVVGFIRHENEYIDSMRWHFPCATENNLISSFSSKHNRIGCLSSNKSVSISSRRIDFVCGEVWMRSQVIKYWTNASLETFAHIVTSSHGKFVSWFFLRSAKRICHSARHSLSLFWRDFLVILKTKFNVRK